MVGAGRVPRRGALRRNALKVLRNSMTFWYTARMSDAAVLEHLEGRLHCSLSVWTGAAGDGLWHTGANWNTLTVPGPDSDVIIDVPFEQPVRFLASAGDTTVASLISREAFSLEGGSLRVLGGAFFGASLVLDGGTLTCEASCELGPLTAWNATTLAGAGTFFTQPMSSLVLGGTQTRTLAARLEQRGIMELAGNPSLLFADGSLHNMEGASIHWTGSGNFLSTRGVNEITNAGTILKNGAMAGSVTVPLHNTGLIEVVSSPMLLFVPGVLAGRIEIAAAGTLALSGDFSYQPGLQLRASGHLIFSSGTHVLPAGSFVATGAVDFDAGSITINDPIHPSNGIIIPTTTSLTLNASQSIGVLQTGGMLSGSGDLTITTSFTWTAGTIGGTGRLTVAAGATMTSSGNGRFLSRPLDNLGTATLQSPGTLFFSGATLTNYGTFTLNASMSNGAGSNLFSNLGQLSKTAGSAITITVPFNNAGTLTNAAAGMTFTSLQNYIASTSTLVGGTWTLTGGATLSVSGAFITTLGTGTSLTLDGPGSGITQAASLSVNRGVLTLGSGRTFNFTAAGNIFHNHGTFVKSGSGSISLPASLIFNNYGQIRVSGGRLAAPGSLGGGGQLSVETQGTFALEQAQSFAGIVNQGSIEAGLFRLTATSSYTQTATAMLGLAISGVSTHGQLAAPSGCVLDGSLVVTAQDGFDPAAGAADLRATLLDSAATSGAFSSLSLPPTAMGTYALVPTGPDLVLLFNFADANGDGGVDGQDVEFYFFLWENGSLLADVNGDGGVDGSDLGVFFGQWEQGGPG
jgi:fibronectin-binding autotransporter adhesin